MNKRSDSPRAISRSSALVAFFAILSPAAGLGLEMTIAWRLGSSTPVDAYRAAYLLISFGSLFASFLLPHLIIPAVTRLRAQGFELYGWRVAITTGYVLASFGLLLLLYGLIKPLSLFALLAPGLGAIPRSDAAFLLGACNIALIATVCCGILSGLLQVYHSFEIPALSQMAFNLSFCFVIAAAGNRNGFTSIAIGIIAGALLMLLLHILAVIRVTKRIGLSLKDALRPTVDREALKPLISGYPLLLVLLSSVLANLVLTRQLSRDGTGALAQFGYAMKLIILAGIAPNALATVIFPSLVNANAHADLTTFHQLASRALRMTLVFLAPLAVFMYIFRRPIVDLLFNRGSMSSAALDEIKLDFGILILQSVLANFNSLLQKLSFALNETRLSAVFSCSALVLLAISVGPASAQFGSAGSVSAYAAVQSLTAAAFFIYLALRFRIVSLPSFLKHAGMIAVLSCGIAAASFLVRGIFAAQPVYRPLYTIFELALGLIAVLISGVLLGRLLRISEIEDLQSQVVSWLRRFSNG